MLHPLRFRSQILRSKLLRAVYSTNACTPSVSSMDKNSVCVRNLHDDEELKISFYHKGKLKDFNRKKNDSLGQTLQRMSLKLQPKAKKKKKKNENEMETGPESITCCLLDENKEIDQNLSNEESFVSGRVLQINDNRHSIFVNPPRVSLLHLQLCIMAGFPIIPNVKLECARIEKSKFVWFKSKGPITDSSDWECICEESIYVPSNDDIDFHLKCVCYPGNDSVLGAFSEEMVSEEVVKAGPGICLFERRHLYTPSYLPSNGLEFRMITYNILANVFADTDYARTELFEFCPPYAIKQDYRRQLLFKELIGYHADLICLQECSLHEYDNYLHNWMTLHGYKGFLQLKLGEMSEGEAFFFRTDRYEHLDDFSVSMQEALQSECNKSIVESLNCSPSLFEKLKEKKAIGQIHLLKEKEGLQRCICVLNTHLFYKRFSSHIRILQMAVFANYLNEKIKCYGDVSVILSGDLNSLRDEGLHEYLSGVEITERHDVWTFTRNLQGMEMKISLRCPLNLTCLSGYPPFTSYVPHCKDTLDYIFGDSSVSKEGFVPMPSEDELKVYVGVPCVVYPSDHLAVILDLRWNSI